MKRLLVVKFPAPLLELTDRRYVQRRRVGICPINAPLPTARIVEAPRESLDVPAGTVGFEFIQVCTAIPNLSRRIMGLEFLPLVGSGQRPHSPLQVHLPGAEKRVLVMLSISPLGLLESRDSRLRHQ